MTPLLWLASFPGSASAGYDIAHIVKRTCEPGGALIVADEWKSPRDRDRLITEPGEVITCPPAGPKDSFQISAGPERIGGEPYLCTYFSLLNGDGADTCITTEPASGEESLASPLMAVRTDESGALALIGIVSNDVATLTTAPRAAVREADLTPVEARRAADLGATRAFSYFALHVENSSLCGEEALRLHGLDASGQVVAESEVPMSTRLLDSADEVPYATSLRGLCASLPSSPSQEIGWWTEIGAMFRSLLTTLI